MMIRRAIGSWVLVALLCALSLDGRAQEPTGTLRVKTDVAQVQVSLDGKDVGATPLTLTNLALGSHALTLTKPGWIDHVESVNVVVGKVASVFVLMKKSDVPEAPKLTFPVKFRVVHVHANGQCVGSIVVQPDAVAFKADDGHDVFAIPIRSVRLVAQGSGVSAGAVAAMGVAVNTGATTYSVADAGSGPLVPLRLETPGRNYTFLAFESGDDRTVVPTKEASDTTAAASNLALFQLVYRLFTEDLKVR